MRIVYLITLLFGIVYSDYIYDGTVGPFIYWGREELSDFEMPILDKIGGDGLCDIIDTSKLVLIFVRNDTMKITDKLPKTKLLITQNDWVYSSQKDMGVDPYVCSHVLGYVHDMTFSGNYTADDLEIVRQYTAAVKEHGKGKVLAILGYTPVPAAYSYIRYKRQAEEIEINSVAPPTDSPDNSKSMTDTVYVKPDKSILYLGEPPVLIIAGNKTAGIPERTINLTSHTKEIQYDEQGDRHTLIIPFIVKQSDGSNVKYIARFRFPVFGGYWTIEEVNIQVIPGSETWNLTAVGRKSWIPIGLSYRCGKGMVFGDKKMNLTLKNMQVQIFMNKNKFDDPYDCVGFMTSGILSGLFVTAIVLLVTVIGIVCILDIKPPNRFESSRSKQLTFTVQE